MRWREAPFSDISLFIIRRLPQSRRSKANFASPSLGRGRALMPAPPFPTNLLLRKIFAGALILPQSRRQHKCWTTRHRLGGARRTPPRSRNGTLHVPFPSSKVVKAPPGLCQESAFSPSSQKTRYAIFVGALSYKSLPRAKTRFCAAGLNLYPQGIHTHRAYIPAGHTYPQGIHTRRAYIPYLALIVLRMT